MKRSITLLLLALLALAPLCNARNRDAQLRSLIRNYKGTSGFEVVRLGGPVLGIGKLIAKTQVEDEEDRAALDLLQGITRLIVVDYEDCTPQVRSEFSRKVTKILRDKELLMEAADGEDRVRIYGILSDDGSSVRDVIIHTETDGALVCFSGSVSMDRIGDLIRTASAD